MAAVKPVLLVLLGPTAVGKSELGLAWAESVGAEIIAADSTTVYRGLDIGTAKPTAAEQARVPHHLLDVVSPGEPFSCARFQLMANQAIADIGARGHLPLLVGGTGLWIRSVVQNFDFPETIDPAWRKTITAWAANRGIEAVRRQLKMVDPVSYTRIAPGDERRLIRALEVFITSGRRLPRTPGPTRYHSLIVGLMRSRQILAQRIAARAQAQIRAGLLDEVLTLMRQGVPWSSQSMMALGYREGTAWARGLLATEEVLPLMVRHNRQYAKRQLTWFFREPQVRWLDLDHVSLDQALRQVIAWTREIVNGNGSA